MPVIVEKLQRNIKTAWGTGYLLSVCHYWEQNGDAMRDPEVVFLVVDNRKDTKDDPLFIAAWPQYVRIDGMPNVDKELITLKANTQTNQFEASQVFSKQQKEIASFTQQWFRTIRSQQRLELYKFKDA